MQNFKYNNVTTVSLSNLRADSIIKMLMFISLFITALLLSSNSEARTYNKLNMGISITVDDYFSQLSQAGNVFYFTAADNSATVIIKNSPGLTMNNIRATSQQGFHEGGISLTAKSKASGLAVQQGKGLSVNVDGFIDQYKVKGLLSGLAGNNGQGLIILVASTPGKWSQILPRARKILSSIRFVKPAGGGGSVVAKWKNYLTGKRVAYRFSRNGMSDREDYYLCSNGTFVEDTGSSGFTSGGGASVYAHAGNNNSGKWRIQAINGKAHIVLSYNNGERGSALLEDRNGQTFIDGKRYSVLDTNQCR